MSSFHYRIPYMNYFPAYPQPWHRLRLFLAFTLINEKLLETNEETCLHLFSVMYRCSGKQNSDLIPFHFISNPLAIMARLFISKVGADFTVVELYVIGWLESGRAINLLDRHGEKESHPISCVLVYSMK